MRHTAACAIAFAVLTAGCRRDPNVTYAHLLERVASWSASVQFAGELSERGLVPSGYVRDVLATASQEVDALREQIADFADAPSADRSKDAEMCARLATMLRADETTGSVSDRATLHDIEAALRADAGHMRGAAALESSR